MRGKISCEARASLRRVLLISSDGERFLEENLHEVNRAELDRILSKIDITGVESLMSEEIAFLNRFSPD